MDANSGITVTRKDIETPTKLILGYFSNGDLLLLIINDHYMDFM